MILSDIIPLQTTAVVAEQSKNKQTSSDIDDCVNSFNDYYAAVKKMNYKSSDNEIREAIKFINEKIKAIRNKNKTFALTSTSKQDIIDGFSYNYDKNYNYIPKIENSTFTSQFMNRSNISDIRDISNKLGLLIIPYNYVDTDVLYKDEIKYKTYTINGRILTKNFNTVCENEGYRAWMVCPIQYYKLSSHAEDTSFNFFIPDSVSQSFNAVKMILPMLIGMNKQLEQVASEVKGLSSQLNMLKQQLQQQQKQINDLQLQINNLQKKQAEEEARRNEEFQRILEQERQAEIRWAAMDPLLIAVPKDIKDINEYDGRVFVGPAWGPEIDTVLLQLHSIGKNKNTSTQNQSLINYFGGI